MGKLQRDLFLQGNQLVPKYIVLLESTKEVESTKLHDQLIRMAHKPPPQKFPFQLFLYNIKIHLHSKIVTSLGCLSFTVNMQSLTLEVCFHIYQLKVENVSVLCENYFKVYSYKRDL